MANVRRVSAAVVLLLIVCAAASTRENHQNEHLQIRLVIDSPRLCLGERDLSAEAILTNNTDAPMEVYRSGIVEFSFTRLIKQQYQWKSDRFAERKDGTFRDPARGE